jgi:DNA-binding FadR family transcriptional regulator
MSSLPTMTGNSSLAKLSDHREAWSIALARSEAHALNPAPISSRGLSGRVVHAIGLRIVGGELAEGEPLPNEADWCMQLGVSRTVLREATKVLISKGLLESRPKTGTRVRAAESWNLLDPDVLAWQLATVPRDRFVRELFELRRAFEPTVAALAALRASPKHLGEMSASLNAMAEAGDDGRRFIVPDTRFHRTILDAVDNGMLRSLSSVIETALNISMYLSLDTPRGQRHSIPLHRAVHDAIAGRDPEAARSAMNKLIDDAEEDAFGALKIHRQKSSTRGRQRK